MAYEAQNYESLLGAEGFSDDLLKNHFKLYEGYVANTNKAADLIKELEAGTPQAAEVRRRFGWEFNGMRLHEIYFSNMVVGGSTLAADSPLSKAIDENFGSWDAWEADFRATGGLRGIGWAVLYHDMESGRLFNAWINEHDGGHFAGAMPLMIMDVFEHAFMLDYGLAKGEYIDSFFNVINWEEVGKRFFSPNM